MTDWEDTQKAAFCQLVSIWLLKSSFSSNKCVRILHEAQRCKKKFIPDDLVSATTEFIVWQTGEEKKPEWVHYA